MKLTKSELAWIYSELAGAETPYDEFDDMGFGIESKETKAFQATKEHIRNKIQAMWREEK